MEWILKTTLFSPWEQVTMQGGSDAFAGDDVVDLVRKAQTGDATSFARLYERFYDRIFRYVSFKTGGIAEAEDITEEVFLRMLESISSFKWQGNPFSSWLFRIAHNLVVDHFRKKARQRQTPLEDAIGIIGESDANLDGNLDVKLTMRDVKQAMEGLTKLQREVITLRFAGGLSLKETAQAVGKKENAVKALQHAGIQNLRRTLNQVGVDYIDRVLPAGSGEVADG